MLKKYPKFGLVAALLVFIGMTVFTTHRVASHTVAEAVALPGTADATQVYFFAFMMMTILILFTTLPVLMIIAYQGLQGDTLTAQVSASLSLCAVNDEQLKQRIQEYEERNSLTALFLPSVVNLMIALVIWQNALLPGSTVDLIQRMGNSATTPWSLALSLAQGATEITPLTWALLGAYFYSINLIIRRWMLSDLTANVLWKVNVRLVVTFVLGMLLIALSGATSLAHALGPTIAGTGFMIGIVPDLFLRWLSQQLKRLGSIDPQQDGLFATSELRRKIEGMSFWQADRLAEEGIESVQDLALKEIPSLLIRTRFDAPLLLNWVDRALLCSQVGQDLELFKDAHLYTGTDLVAAVQRPRGMDSLLQSMTDAAASGTTKTGTAGPTSATITPTITAATIANIISGVSNGPNLRHLTTYRKNASDVVALPAIEPEH